MDTERITIYAELLNQHKVELNKLVKKGRWVSISRGILFFSIIIFLFFIWNLGISYTLIFIVLSIIPFLFLVKLNVSINSKINYLKELIAINQNEISGLKSDYSGFAQGEEYINPDHPYSFDLDIFGNGSIYQLVNRSCTTGGANLLADSLKGENNIIDELSEKQSAIQEMSAMLNWRQDFQATGNIVLESSKSSNSSEGWFQSNNQKYSAELKFHDEMIEWLASPFAFADSKVLKYLLLGLPAISLILLGLVISGLFPIMGFILFGLFQLVIVGWNLKKINQIHAHIGRKTQILRKYGSLLSRIENQNFTSTYLQSLKNVSGINNKNASKQLNRLQSLASALDNRLNILFAIFANAYLLWDLQVVFRIENWRKKNMQMLPNWFAVIYKFDALSGFATFSFNHPSYCFPQLQAEGFILDMEQAGHPLISNEIRINNDLKIDGYSQLLVLTGANMAGKSTFLRTVGVNMVLAMAGSAVCAKKFLMSPVGLHTSIRTTDSVQKSESYFFAELKRLKSIIDRMQAGEHLFIIIDEMLRGTNSKDKHLGSEALIEQLIRLNGSGLLATHDIALGSLAEKYPENVKNCRFEVEIKDNELVFDYKLKTGISQNLNATFLMKKMGITL